MLRGKWLAVLCSVALAASGCGGDENGDAQEPTSTVIDAADDLSVSDDDTSEEAPVSSPSGSTGDAAAGRPTETGPIASMLAHVPDGSANRRQLVINDYEGALAASGLTWPPSGDREARGDVLAGLTYELEPPILLTPGAFGDLVVEVDEWRTELGFSIVDARRDLVTGEAPGVLSVVETDRSRQEIEEAIRSDPVWGADLNEIGSGAAAYFTWLDDPFAVSIDRRSAPRPLGRAGAVAVLDGGRVIRSVDPGVVEGALRVVAGESRSLADDESYLAVATALDAAGVYSALLTSENVVVDPAFLLLADPVDDPPTAEELQERLDSIRTVPQYLALGIGNKVDLDSDPKGVLMLVFATQSPQAAEATVASMEDIVANGTSIASDRPWSELVAVRATSTDGSLAVIELQTENPRIGASSFYQRDTLFVTG